MGRFDTYNRLLFRNVYGLTGGKGVVVIPPPGDYDVLLSLLTHWKTRLRWQAADILGKIGDRRAVAPLIRSLGDTHWLVRLHAASALGRIGDPAAVDALIDGLKDCSFVKRRVVTALGRIGDPSALEPLLDALQDCQSVRCAALTALGKFDAVGPFIHALRSERADQLDLWFVLRRVDNPGRRIARALVSALDDPDERVRMCAALTLVPYRVPWRYQKLKAAKRVIRFWLGR